jgi:hypothetical protein
LGCGEFGDGSIAQSAAQIFQHQPPYPACGTDSKSSRLTSKSVALLERCSISIPTARPDSSKSTMIPGETSSDSAASVVRLMSFDILTRPKCGVRRLAAALTRQGGKKSARCEGKPSRSKAQASLRTPKSAFSFDDRLSISGACSPSAEITRHDSGRRRLQLGSGLTAIVQI